MWPTGTVILYKESWARKLFLCLEMKPGNINQVYQIIDQQRTEKSQDKAYRLSSLYWPYSLSRPGQVCPPTKKRLLWKYLFVASKLYSSFFVFYDLALTVYLNFTSDMFSSQTKQSPGIQAFEVADFAALICRWWKVVGLTMMFRPRLVGPWATIYSIPVSYTSMGLRYLNTVPAMLKFFGLSTLKFPLK